MKSYIKEINGLKFYCRVGTSDEKSVDEVVGRNVYQRKDFKIVAGESWLDLGANIGAFAVLAASLGAKVTCFEPDPISFQILKENIKLNKLNVMVYDAGVAVKKTKSYLHVSPTNQFWRNSMVKFGKGKVIEVKSIALQPFLTKGVCVKMDIEGMEMPILETLDFSNCSKMVYEWSFDIDDKIDRYRAVGDRMNQFFDVVKIPSIKTEHKIWQKSWFPPCKNVFCYNR